jgi:DNA-binding XRE family transcriptional regulator
LQAGVSVKRLWVNDRILLKKIGRVVREKRLSLDFTQECLAELVSVHWQTISAIERGVYPVSLLTFARLCQHLEIGPEKLLEGIPLPDVRRAKRIKKALVRKRRPAGGEP